MAGLLLPPQTQSSWEWGCTPVISALRELRQEDRPLWVWGQQGVHSSSRPAWTTERDLVSKRHIYIHTHIHTYIHKTVNWAGVLAHWQKWLVGKHEMSLSPSTKRKKNTASDVKYIYLLTQVYMHTYIYSSIHMWTKVGKLFFYKTEPANRLQVCTTTPIVDSSILENATKGIIPRL